MIVFEIGARAIFASAFTAAGLPTRSFDRYFELLLKHREHGQEFKTYITTKRAHEANKVAVEFCQTLKKFRDFNIDFLDQLNQTKPKTEND